MFTRRYIALLFFLNILMIQVNAQKKDPPFLQYINHPWVDSVLNTLSINQKIAQSIWIPAWSDRDSSHVNAIVEAIGKYGPGGIIFFQGNAEKQAILINQYQKISQVPVITAMDAEWGVGMRLVNTEKFPYQLTLGAIRNDSLIYRFGKEVAEQCRRTGININLAPVADINNNPENPVINYRSFGENRENVSSKTIIYMNALQDNGVMATAKHFPGHGDTDVDSHSDLPVLKHSRERLDTIELYPFRKLIDEGAGIVMTAHLNLPLLDSTNNIPASLSSVIIKDLLIKQLGFRGLIMTDAMNMKGVTRYFKPGEAEALAYRAGNDVIEYISDIQATLSEINNDLKLKRITEEEINQKCRKILALKYWAHLDKPVAIDTAGISKDINSGEIKALIRDLYANSLTLLRNEQNILPVRNLGNIRIATVAVNQEKTTVFQKRISLYKNADNYFIDPGKSDQIDNLINRLSDYDLVITGVYGTSQRPDREFGITRELEDLLENLISKTRTVITWFGNPYALDKVECLRNAAGLLLTYQENEYAEDIAAQMIFGAIGARGSLPVTVNELWPYDFGLITPGNLRMQYGLPENAGMSSEILNEKIDSIVKKGLELKAFPGCEVMVSREGIVVFHKTYGFHTYDSTVSVGKDDLYDLASLTKVTATTAGLMLLNSEGKFMPEETLGNYLPLFRHSKKGDLKMTEILTHQAGLIAWIPFWEKTVKKNGKYKKRIYDTSYSDKYPVEVANELFIRKNYSSRIIRTIKKSPLGEKKYLYSDLGFIISPCIIETLSGEKWDNYITKNIYQKLGADCIVFNPYLKYPPERIIPTEFDSLFRRQLLHGTVHDEGAALLGGISGHAGLFATANDLMKLTEMYRRMGSYGGEQIIAEDVMRKYTTVQFPENNNRRGLGFDKPLLNNNEVLPQNSNTAISASMSSFGHTGFTGTYVWADPEYGLSYVFLSNRVNPTRNNNLITQLNIRTNILQAIYDSILW